MSESEKKGNKKLINIIVSVIAVIVISFVAKLYNKPNPESQIEQTLESIPLYQTIKKQDPVTYQRIKAKMLTAVNENKPIEQITLDLMDEMVAQLSSRVIYAPDNNVIDFVDVIVDDMQYLQSREQDLCFKYLFPGVAGGIEYARIMPEEKMQKMLNTYNDFLLATYNVATPIVNSQQRVQDDLESVRTIMYSKYGDGLQQLANPGAANVDRQLVCTMSIDFYSEIRKLPDERSAQLLRTVLS